MRQSKTFSAVTANSVTANSNASNRPILVFMSCPQVSGNQQKPKKNYMTADGYTDKIWVLWASRIFDSVNEFFFSKDSV